eukprot:7387180-Alexandrium_andersonii.AAC.1
MLSGPRGGSRSSTSGSRSGGATLPWLGTVSLVLMLPSWTGCGRPSRRHRRMPCRSPSGA